MYLQIILGLSLLTLMFVGYLITYVLKHDQGPKEMQDIAEAIKEGANAFLKRQYKTITIISLLLAVGIVLSKSAFLARLNPFE